ncbi:hypothetical protein GQ53DRAFT_750763 [Thozetella sp. PMI_491]|nr:hypothetical protein GQ53DRAFT_750763 [Thozetella sp. PMI_491]
MRKTYIPAPDFSTAPPPDGPVNLGHVLKNLSDFCPLNDQGHIAVTRPLPTDEKTGFKMSRRELLSGDFGIFAQILAIFGVGVDTNTSYEKGSDDILTIDRLETITFNPSESYIRDSLECNGVKIFLKGCEYRKPVFMVTGIKIARGASLHNSRIKTVGGKLKVGFSHPGIPVEAGPDIGLKWSRQETVAFEGSSDFVLAIRVKKIRYKKGEIVSSPHYKGATMMDRKTRQAFALDLEIAEEEIEPRDVSSREDMIMIDGTPFDDDDLSTWILPKTYRLDEQDSTVDK